MDIVDQIPILIFHVLKANISKDAGIVDKNIDTAEVLNGSLNDLVSEFYAIVVGYGVSTLRLDFIDDDIRSLLPLLACLTRNNMYSTERCDGS